MAFTLDAKKALIYYIAITLIAILLAFFYFNTLTIRSTEKSVDHTNLVIDKNNEILLNMVNIETGVRGYILTNKKEFLKPYYQSQQKINQNIVMLQLLTNDNPTQGARAAELKKLIEERLTLSKSLIENKSRGNNNREMMMLLYGQELMDATRKNINAINRDEISLLYKRKAENSTSIHNSNKLLSLFFALVVIILVFIYFAFRNHRKVNSELESFYKLQKAASQYSRSLLEASLDPLVTISIEGKITDVNNASVKVTGVERETLIGTDFSNYFTEPKKAQEGYRQVFEKGFVANYPLTIKHTNGNLTAVLYNASVYKDDKGNVLGVFAAARDVTDAKEAQEKLQASEERIRLATKASGVGVWEWNVITNKISWDAQMFCIYGVAPTADGLIDYSTWSSAVAPEDLAAQEKILQDTVKNVATSNRSFKIYRANDGMQCFIEAIETVRINAVGQAEWVVGTNLDVTEQKKSSQYARKLIEASLDPLVTISASGKILDVNEASIKVTGVEREKLVGTDFSDYFTVPKKAQEGYRQVFENGFVEDYPLTIKHTNGKLTDVLYNASVYKDDNDNVLGVFAAARDITEQNKQKLKSDITNKNLEDSYDSLQLASQYSLSLIESSRDPMFVISVTGKITDTNQATVNATDVSRKNLIGSDFISYFTDPEKAKKGYEEIFSKGFVVDFPLIIKDHKLTDVLFNGAVYKDNNDIIIGAVAVARDITEQKKYEKELTVAKVYAELASKAAEDAKVIAENATIKAEVAVKSKQQFLSNMSHEIRTPMNAIIGFTKVVLKTDLTAKQKEYLMAIKMSGDALIVLINDILDLAKVDAGKMTFEKTPFKLHLSIKAMLHLFETKIQEKNLKLVTVYDKKIPQVLVGDPVRLHQIILNLVSNAVKFTNQGKITVSVTLLSENDTEVALKFAVADTGIGIKEKKMEQIFENFQQATSGTSRIFGGTGLGLAIVKQLVQAQDGTIDVSSEFGKGSTFSFNLVFKKTTADAVPEPEIEELNNEIKDTKILVVEDMELNQLLMKTVLDDFGFECEIAANGKIAIEKLQNQGKNKPFDIILMDLQMPEMNGFQATEYIRKIIKSDIPIIALTADVTTIDVAKCKAVGMNDYISKPVDERLLYSKMIGYIKKPVSNNMQKIGALKNIEKLKYVDMTYLRTLTKSNSILITELINSYLKQTPVLIEVMQTSFQDKNWKLLNATIHKMLPSFNIIGMSSDITKLANKIQEYPVNTENLSKLEDLVQQLVSVCTQSCSELEEELINFK